MAIVDVCTGMLACNSILAALQARPDGHRAPPPTLGQPTAEILRDELGMTDQRIGELRAQGVV